MRAQPKTSSVSYKLDQVKVCGKTVKYANDEGVNFYAPKPVAGQDTPPDSITLTVEAAK